MTRKNLSEKVQKFMSQNPTVICRVAGVTFYESPTLGDETPLKYITKDGKIKCSGFWDAPNYSDVLNLLTDEMKGK